MDIIKEQIDDLNAQIKIQLTKEDLDPKVNASLTDIRKKAQLKGFRPGKVPMGLIKKMYGQSVVYEEVNKLVSESLSKYLEEEKLDLLGEPIPTENLDSIDFDKDKEYNFSFDVGLRPEFEVTLNKKTKYPYYDIQVDDELINKYIDSHADRHGKIETIDEMTEKAFIKGEIVQIDSEGNVVEEGLSKEESSISIAHIKDEDTKKQFLEAKKDDVLKIDINKTFASDTEVSMVLGIDKEQVADIDPNFQYTIKEITEFKRAEVNEELFEKVFPEQEVKTEEDFRAKIKEEIKEATVKDSDYKFSLDAKEKLVEKVDVPLPEDFLSRWLKLKNQKQEFSEEQFNEEFPKIIKDFKWQLIVDKIVKDNEIKVEADEVKDLAVELTEMQFQQYYGMPAGSLPKEQMEQYATEMFLKKEEEVRKLYDRKYQDKAVQVIKESVKIEAKEISGEDFNKLLSEK